MFLNLTVPVVVLTGQQTTSSIGEVHELAFVPKNKRTEIDTRKRKTKRYKHKRENHKIQLKRGYVILKDNVYISRCYSIREKKEVFEEANKLAEIHGEVKIVTMYEVCEERRDLYTISYIEPKHKQTYELTFVKENK